MTLIYLRIESLFFTNSFYFSSQLIIFVISPLVDRACFVHFISCVIPKCSKIGLAVIPQWVQSAKSFREVQVKINKLKYLWSNIYHWLLSIYILHDNENVFPILSNRTYKPTCLEQIFKQNAPTYEGKWSICGTNTTRTTSNKTWNNL